VKIASSTLLRCRCFGSYIISIYNVPKITSMKNKRWDHLGLFFRPTRVWSWNKTKTFILNFCFPVKVSSDGAFKTDSFWSCQTFRFWFSWPSKIAEKVWFARGDHAGTATASYLQDFRRAGCAWLAVGGWVKGRSRPTARPNDRDLCA